MTDSTKHEDILSLTGQIVSSYLSNNTVAASDIPRVIDQVFRALSDVKSGAGDIGIVKRGRGRPPGSGALLSADRPAPAVPIRKSIQPDYIVCLEDGKKMKMLKRHLRTSYKMTPEQYRERWGLPADYPMTAPNYAKKRSKLAKDIGLGHSRRKAK